MTRNILKVKRTMFINLLEIKQRNNAWKLNKRNVIK